MNPTQIGAINPSGVTASLGTMALAYERLGCAHRTAEKSRLVKRTAIKQRDAGRVASYNALMTMTHLLRNDAERVTRLAWQLERRQLVLGLQLLELQAR